MILEMLTRLELTKDEIQSLWDQQVSMDDWDYLLVVNPKDVFSEESGEFHVHYAYPLERLLDGCCSNEWYGLINFRNKECFIGVAYHA